MGRVRSWLPAAASGLLVVYLLLLLALTYVEQQTAVEADAEQVRLGMEKRASALSYFYSVRRDDLSALAENRALTTFFSNRDLGMSMEYGLGASLLAIRRTFDRLVDQRRLAGESVYLRILLREPDGTVLVDTKPRQALNLVHDEPAASYAGSILAQGEPSHPSAVVREPLNYKGRPMGHLLAWVDQDLAHRQLIAAVEDKTGGQLVLHIAGASLPAGWRGSDSADSTSVWRSSGGGFSARVPVADTPFELLGSFPPSGISRFLPPLWFTGALAILAVLVLGGVWAALRIRTDNLVLRARIEESTRQEKILNRKNQELELENVQRRESERELLQARYEAEAASQAKSEFLATMSHEIRTPLNGVIGMAQVLEETELDSDQTEYVQVINDSGRALLSIINDILDFSKIEAGRMTLEAAPFDLKACTEEVIRLLAGKASEKGLALNLDFAPECTGRFLGDAGRVRQVLLNLVGNAVKFSERGKVDIVVSKISDRAGKTGLRIEVEDTGIGIPEEQQAKLFQTFTQVDGSSTRRFSGTGLGLAISKKLVELMGGLIDYTSAPGEGSRFWFELELPAALEAGSHPVPVQAQDERDDEAQKPLSGQILLAEDVFPNRLMAGSLLKKLGLDVDFVENGTEAVEMWKSGSYDLILMDCHMPVMDGYQATKAIRDLEQDGHIPVIALTADAFDHNRDRCLEAGMDDFLSKPFESKQLRAVLELWLTPTPQLPVNAEESPVDVGKAHSAANLNG